MSGGDYTWGSFRFEDVAKGFVSFRLDTEQGLIREFLCELGLLKRISKKRWAVAYEWDPDFKEFLVEHGYCSDADVLRAMRTTGLLLKSDRAIAFRLRFL